MTERERREEIEREALADMDPIARWILRHPVLLALAFLAEVALVLLLVLVVHAIAGGTP